MPYLIGTLGQIQCNGYTDIRVKHGKPDFMGGRPMIFACNAALYEPCVVLVAAM